MRLGKGLRTVWWGVVLLLVLLSNGTQAGAAPAAPYTYYLPLWQAPEHVLRLGLAGGTPEQVRTLGGDWLYDWSATPQGSAQVEAVPMIGTARHVGQALGGNSDWLLLFNEPDLCPWQACLSPAEAVGPYLRSVALYPQVWLVSPAPSSEDFRRMWAPGSTYPGWLPLFREAVRSETGYYPDFQALAMHCYEWTAEACIRIGEQYLRWAEEWGVPEIWITEFAFVQAWAPDAEREARAFLSWAERQARITRIAPYTAHTPLGVWYWPDTRPEADPSLFQAPASLEMTPLAHWYRRIR